MSRALVARATVVLVVVLAGWVAANGALWYRTADFYCLREGARLAAAGQDPYDESLWRTLVTTQFPDPLRGFAVALAVATASLVPWSFYALAFARGQENLSALVPVAAALAVALVVRLAPDRA